MPHHDVKTRYCKVLHHHDNIILIVTVSFLTSHLYICTKHSTGTGQRPEAAPKI